MTNPTLIRNFIEALNEADDLDVIAEVGEVFITDDDGDPINPLTDEKIPSPLNQDGDGSIAFVVENDDGDVLIPATDDKLQTAIDSLGDVDSSVSDVETAVDGLDIQGVIDEVDALEGIVATDSTIDDVREAIEGDGRLEDTLTDVNDKFSSVFTVDESVDVGESNAVEVEVLGRPFVEIYYEAPTDSTLVVETSSDESTWREFDRLDTSEDNIEQEATEQFPWIARRYLRAYFEGGSGSGVIDIAGAR